MRRWIVVSLGAGLAALGLTIVAAGAAGIPTAHFTVNPGAWTHTGIQLKQGQSASISATGSMYFRDQGPKSGWGPGGYYLIGFQNYDLKAKVGKAITDIGGSGAVYATQPGELLLGAGRAYEPNPADSKTIAGHFDATVTSSAIVPGGAAGGGGGSLDPAAGLAVLAGLATATAGAAAGAAGGAGGAASSGDGRPARRGYCAGEQDRMTNASAAAKTAQFRLGLANSVRNLLEAKRENIRESGYLSGVNWVAWAASGQAAVPAETLMAGIIESTLKGLGSEVMNQFTNFCLDQDVDLGEILRQGAGAQQYSGGPTLASGGGAAWPVAEKVKDLLVKFQLNLSFKLSGVAADSPAGALVTQTVTAGAADLTNLLGNAFSVAGFASGVKGSIDALAAIDQQIADVRSKQSQYESDLDSALQEMDLARSALNYCLQLHPEEAA